MVVGVARITLHLPASRSLKDKRQVVRSLLAQVRNRFDVAAAEVDRLDRWQIAVIGLSCVSTDSRHADEIMAKVVDFVANRKVEAEMMDYETEVMHVF